MPEARDDYYTVPSGGNLGAGIAVPPGIPAWRQAMTTLTWAEVGSNTIDDLNPRYNPAINPVYPAQYLGGQQYEVIEAWNGACWVEAVQKLYLGPNGGHANYAGNETYIWDAQTGDWSMGKPPSKSIGHDPDLVLDDGEEATGVYSDGRVRSYHSYSLHADRNGVAWFFGGSVWSIGSGPTNVSRIWRWDNDELDWADDSGFVIPGYVASGVTYDPKRDLFWIIPAGTAFPRTYDPDTNDYDDSYTQALGNGNYVRPMYDPVRDGIVMLTGALDAAPVVRYLKLPSVSAAVSISPTGSAPPVLSRGGGAAGLVHDSARDRFLVYTGGTTIYVLTPPASDPVGGTWAWSTLTPASGSVTPGDAQVRGTYGRFWYSPTLNCVGVVNSTTQKMHVFALED